MLLLCCYTSRVCRLGAKDLGPTRKEMVRYARYQRLGRDEDTRSHGIVLLVGYIHNACHGGTVNDWDK